MRRATRSYLIVFSFFFVTSCEASKLDGCMSSIASETITHAAVSELRYGETMEIKEEALNKLKACLNKDSEVCIVGFRKTSDANIVYLWQGNSAEEGKNYSYSEKTDSILIAAAQPKTQNKRRGCIVASRLLVHATPWYVKGWYDSNGKIKRSDQLTYYSNIPMTVSPKKMEELLLKTFNNWVSDKKIK